MPVDLMYTAYVAGIAGLASYGMGGFAQQALGPSLGIAAFAGIGVAGTEVLGDQGIVRVRRG